MTRLLFAAVLLIAPAVLAQTETPTPEPVATPAATPEATPVATPSATPTPEPTPPPVPAWKGSVEAGATSTSGNTDVQTNTGALKVDGAWRGWGVAVRSAGVYAETEDVQTAGAWDASVRGDRVIAGILGAYARLSIDGDRFKGFENRKGAGAGLSVAKKWAAPTGGYDIAGLRAEAGYQFYREDLVGTDDDNYVHAARGFVGAFRAISKESGLSEELEVLYDVEAEGRYLVTSVTALSVKLRKNLALRISETVKMDTEPPLTDPADPDSARFEEVDTLTAFALQLSF